MVKSLVPDSVWLAVRYWDYLILLRRQELGRLLHYSRGRHSQQFRDRRWDGRIRGGSILRPRLVVAIIASGRWTRKRTRYPANKRLCSDNLRHHRNQKKYDKKIENILTYFHLILHLFSKGTAAMYERIKQIEILVSFV